ncbi:uncharacterized protein N7511_005772 [Penicillium nucicola]|uniref:uncharacterized protein n=1 Tax=Penicillium nucicola TaxID=1850975 RepID=UPI002544DEDA|nr:uncharacterized protein N7511_005772 [Penicillium nucicola]KAJ5762390.1 hypothetical protein N7511_005772 [Penicillium nucicola]
MTPIIKNVALAGASGNVGAQVLNALLGLNFNVTVLARSSKPFPAAAKVKIVDFTSVESLSAALDGQDAVIDTTFSPEVDTSLRLIEAAVKARVYRFITSDFGLDPEIPGVHNMPVFSQKKGSYEAVKEQAAANRLTYTLVANGPFLDWGLSTGFSGLNFREKTAWRFGDGNNVIPWTTLADVGTATANVLLHPEETLNRPVYIHSVFMSQNQLLGAAKSALGSEEWTVTNNDMEPLLQKALSDLQSGNITDATFEIQIKYCLATKALAHPWERDDNSLLGLKEWSAEKVEDLVRAIAKEQIDLV